MNIYQFYYLASLFDVNRPYQVLLLYFISCIVLWQLRLEVITPFYVVNGTRLHLSGYVQVFASLYIYLSLSLCFHKASVAQLVRAFDCYLRVFVKEIERSQVRNLPEALFFYIFICFPKGALK